MLSIFLLLCDLEVRCSNLDCDILFSSTSVMINLSQLVLEGM